MYYWPEKGTLSILPGKVSGGRVDGKALFIKDDSASAEIKTTNQGATPLELQILLTKEEVTLDKIKDAVISENACATKDTTIVWNETKLLKDN